MQANRDRLTSMLELVGRLNGANNIERNMPTMSSRMSVRADGTIFINLPSRSLLPPVDIETGAFYFMADYSAIDGDDVVR